MKNSGRNGRAGYVWVGEKLINVLEIERGGVLGGLLQVLDRHSKQCGDSSRE